MNSAKYEWLSGGVSPCQGEGRGFESRLALLLKGSPMDFLFRIYIFTSASMFIESPSVNGLHEGANETITEELFVNLPSCF